MCIRDRSGLVDLTYEDYEGVTPKLISYSDCTLFVTIDDQEFQFEFDSTKKGDIFFVSGDANGTIWTVSYTHLDVYKRQGS